ncbi:hypothetical protein BaRGS_00039002 [Batillaria attramentaria]|uniref:Uncharacterized protein n=1 Tax=Batillaria attramentaria TaxID=370345 RepID=A0ABD0J491_9CAEN
MYSRINVLPDSSTKKSNSSQLPDGEIPSQLHRSSAESLLKTRHHAHNESAYISDAERITKHKSPVIHSQQSHDQMKAVHSTRNLATQASTDETNVRQRGHDKKCLLMMFSSES